MKKLKYHIGIDIAWRNLGLSIINKHTRDASLQITDLATWNGEFHHITSADFGQLIAEFITSYQDIFAQTEKVYFEELPTIGSDDVRMCLHYMTQTIKVLHPHIKIRFVTMQANRGWWNTRVKRSPGWSADKVYRENKKASARLTHNVLSESEMIRAHSVFKKGSTFHVDAIEALQICMYGMERFKNEEPDAPSIPKAFHRIVMSSKAYMPSQPNTRKRHKQCL